MNEDVEVVAGAARILAQKPAVVGLENDDKVDLTISNKISPMTFENFILRHSFHLKLTLESFPGDQ